MVSVPCSHLGSPRLRVQRFLVLASLALPLFILGSWALQAAADNPTNRDMVLVTAVALGLAFALLLALFSLHLGTHADQPGASLQHGIAFSIPAQRGADAGNGPA